MKRRMQRGVFAAAMAAALGFGGAQAFASPAAAAADESRACSSGQCTQECRRIGYNVGVCESGTCVCYFTAR
ncbi:MAG TPA: hypothetical protein VE871_01505 [Longimicrobium sp.]|nr:hypothetical protein [Longimicrobium sp.]